MGCVAGFHHDDGGTSIKLDAIPIGLPEWNGWINVFPRKPREESPTGPDPRQAQARHQASQQVQAPRTQSDQPFDDDIPF